MYQLKIDAYMFGFLELQGCNSSIIPSSSQHWSLGYKSPSLLRHVHCVSRQCHCKETGIFFVICSTITLQLRSALKAPHTHIASVTGRSRQSEMECVTSNGKAQSKLRHKESGVKRGEMKKCVRKKKEVSGTSLVGWRFTTCFKGQKERDY